MLSIAISKLGQNLESFKVEINNTIDKLPKFKYIIVEELPEVGETDKIYLLISGFRR